MVGKKESFMKTMTFFSKKNCTGVYFYRMTNMFRIQMQTKMKKQTTRIRCVKSRDGTALRAQGVVEEGMLAVRRGRGNGEPFLFNYTKCALPFFPVAFLPVATKR